MRDELEQQLMDKFPFMESKNLNGKPIGSPIICECDDGWFPIIWGLCDELNKLYTNNSVPLDEIFVFQCKEKLGGLRFYTSELIDGGNEIICKYEDLSYKTCEVCGKEGEIRKDKYWQTLCDDCYRRRYH